MLPSPVELSVHVSNMGISPRDHVIVYTHADCFSAPRVWWTFKTFHHMQVSVLNGGMKAWKIAGGDVATGPVDPVIKAEYRFPRLNKNMVS